mmetsp:Transcript_11290/g.25709  ORF Transcript_11290/g.25709 Transcript_11290/m.25709 type:complete len:403 (+) Transcript_11290:75-1283(+)
MAPKAKRSAPAQAASKGQAAKKAKVVVAAEVEPEDPLAQKCKAVTTALDSAVNLPGGTRDMLKGVIPYSLMLPKSERHAHQEAAVELIGLALSHVETTLSDEVAKLETSLSEGAREKASLEAAVATAVEAHQTSDAAVADHLTKVSDAQAACDAAHSRTQQAEVAKKSIEDQVLAITTSKTTYQTALESAQALQAGTLNDEDTAAAVKAVLPLCEERGMDDALTKAFPAAVSRPKEERGQFDEVVFTEVVTVIQTELGNLESQLEAQAQAMETQSSELEGAHAAASHALQHKEEVDLELKLKQETQAAAKEHVKSTEGAVATLESSLVRLQDQLNQANAHLSNFRSGTLVAFNTLNSTDADIAAATPQASPREGKVGDMMEDVKQVPTPCRNTNDFESGVAQ